MARRIALLRHSATEWNLEGRFQGRSDVILAPQSIERLKSLRVPDWLKKMRLYSSPLVRCLQTAQALMPDTTLETSEHLIERDYGLLEGVSYGDKNGLKHGGFVEHADRTWDWRPVNGESNREILERFFLFANSLVDDCFCVTHTGPIQCALACANNSTNFPAIEHEALYMFEVRNSRELSFLAIEHLSNKQL